jgi:hypothetical protein
MKFSQVSLYFLPLGPKYYPHILFSNTLILCFSYKVRDHVSRPYKTTSRNMVFHILIFKFLNRRWQNKRFCTEQYVSNLICTSFIPECNFEYDVGLIFRRLAFVSPSPLLLKLPAPLYTHSHHSYYSVDIPFF